MAHLESALVESILTARPFSGTATLDALLRGSLDEDRRNEVYRELFVPINLNSASEEEILLIPGVGRRMAHEFEECRPYRSLEQFRQEIGKYVDDEEVARLERYMTIDEASKALARRSGRRECPPRLWLQGASG